MSKKYKVIIAGSRDFDDYEKLKKNCDRILKGISQVEIVSGCARGADRLGERYADERGYKLHKFPADWDRWGRSAGYRRNEQMANVADIVIVFWNGISVGTKHMIDIARKNNIPLSVVDINTKEAKVIPEGLSGSGKTIEEPYGYETRRVRKFKRYKNKNIFKRES